MDVSIVLPIFNGEKFIERQLETIVDSIEFCNFNCEILLGDDGSTDNSLELIRNFIDKHNHITIKLFNVNGNNLSQNLNFLVSRVSGRVIFFSDQDDVWEKTKINIQMNILDNYDYCTHDVDFFFDNKLKINKLSIISPKLGLNNFLKNTIIGSSMALRIEFASSIFPIKYQSPHDQLIATYGSFFKGFVINEVLVHHRIHNSNLSSTGGFKPSNNLKFKFMIRIALIFDLFRSRFYK
jgi:glycosyltransferase involved in cell wall biosynthesis